MESAPTQFSDLSAALIDENYRQLGCDAWDRGRFWRLCAKLQRTPREMAALLRISHDHLRKRLVNGFTPQDGVILALLDREIDQIQTGKPPQRGLFMFVELKKK